MRRLLLLLLLALPAFSQHAYWRLNMTAGNTTAMSIAEWKFFDVSTAQIATTGGTASASILNGNAPLAFDADASTFWNSGGPPAWVQYQFASAVSPVSWTLQTRTSLGSQVPSDVSVQYSDNGTTWTDQSFYYGLNWSGAANATITLNSTNAAPVPIGISWRLLITACQAGGSTDTSLAELKFYDGSGTLITPTSQYAAITSSSFIAGSGEVRTGYFAFDLDDTTLWASFAAPSGGSPQWVGYRFASSAISPASFSITARAGAPTQSPSSFSLQYSTDEITWTTVGTYTAASWTTGGQVQTFGGVQRARHRVNTE